MASDAAPKIVDVNADNVDATGFFCLRSKRESEGYRRKRAWLEARFAEGLRIKMGAGTCRGFIEYIPGGFGWRAVFAEDYMLIHCLWITGRSKGQGLGTALLAQCERDTQALGLNGVAVVTSESTWLAGPKFYAKHGFEMVDRAPPSFALMVRRFKSAAPPRFPDDWPERSARCGPGLVVVRTNQCPYLPATVDVAREIAAERGIDFTVRQLETWIFEHRTVRGLEHGQGSSARSLAGNVGDEVSTAGTGEGREQRRGDRQVEVVALLLQVGGGEVDDHDLRLHREAAVLDRRAHPFAALAHRGVGKAHDLHLRQTVVDVDLDQDRAGVDAPGGGGCDSCQHQL